jgi:hypothetical protein
LSGKLPTLISNREDAIPFVCSLGDSIASVLNLLPQRSAFGQLVDASGVIDEDGELQNGLDERFSLNNFMTVDESLDGISATIVNHFTIDALTIHHEEVTTAVKTILRAITSRSSVANFPVVATFTFDAIEAMGSMNDIYMELIAQGFTPISRAKVNELLENETPNEVLDLLGLDIIDQDEYALDAIFGNSDILLYLPIVNL